MGSYFDPSDYETPIHQYLDQCYISMEYGRSVMSNLFFTKNYIELNDDYVGLFSKTSYDYYY